MLYTSGALNSRAYSSSSSAKSNEGYSQPGRKQAHSSKGRKQNPKLPAPNSPTQDLVSGSWVHVRMFFAMSDPSLCTEKVGDLCHQRFVRVRRRNVHQG